MTLKLEKNLKDFDFWGNAASNAAKLTSDELEELDTQLEEINGVDGAWTPTEVNDIMAFQFEDVCEWLGLDYEEVMARE